MAPLLLGLLISSVISVECRPFHAEADAVAATNALQSGGAASADGYYYMSCGTAALCAVLVVETGLGDGPYRHDKPVLHGLWPQDGSFGSSVCIRPKKSTADLPYDRRRPDLLECYDQNLNNGMTRQEHGFANHEWDKHGKCAGVKDVHDYLDEACGLAGGPLQVMAAARRRGVDDTYEIAEELYQAGYPVWKATYRDVQEIQISACANADGTWFLADPAEFGILCGPSSKTSVKPPSLSSPPSSVPGAGAGQCVPGVRGPACSGNADCSGISGCVRCAKSGFCTNIA